MQGRRGHWAVYYTSPHSLIITFSLFVGLTTLGTFIEFLLVGSLSRVSKRFNNGSLILCIIIKDVNQFIYSAYTKNDVIEYK